MKENIKGIELGKELKPSTWEKLVIKIREFFKRINNSDLPRPPAG